MRSFKVLGLTGVAIWALGTQAAQQSDKDAAAINPTITGTSVSVDCLDVFNEARAAAGLAAFTNGTDEFTDVKNKETFANDVCTAIMTQKHAQNPENITKTLALAIQDGTTGDCAAAVTHFNGALPLFGDLPPAFSTKTEVYQNLQAISFVALYNPQENPKLACSYFTCTSNSTSAGTDSASSLSRTEEGKEGESLVVTTKGLLCATAPQALKDGVAPFTQEEFDKIKGAINFATSGIPTMGVLAAAAVGLLLF